MNSPAYHRCGLRRYPVKGDRSFCLYASYVHGDFIGSCLYSVGGAAEIQSGEPCDSLWIYEPYVRGNPVGNFSGRERAGSELEYSGGSDSGLPGHLCGQCREEKGIKSAACLTLPVML